MAVQSSYLPPQWQRDRLAPDPIADACLTEDFVLLPPAYAVDESRIQGTRVSLPGSRAG